MIEKSKSIKNITFTRSTLPHIDYKILSDMLKKESDELIIAFTRDYFQLYKYLSDDRMKINFEWF
jgi:hypothetical protein